MLLLPVPAHLDNLKAQDVCLLVDKHTGLRLAADLDACEGQDLLRLRVDIILIALPFVGVLPRETMF